MLNRPPRIFLDVTHRLHAVKFQMVGQSKARENGYFFFIIIIYIPILTSSVSHYNSVTTTKEWL